MKPSMINMRRAWNGPARTRLKACAFLLAAALFLVGCTEMSVPKATPQPVPTPSPMRQNAPDLAGQAAKYWDDADWPRAELLYSRLAERGDIPPLERLRALERLAQSAYNAKHYHEARHALDLCAAQDKGVLTTWPWHEQYIKTLVALGRSDLLATHQAWIMDHKELPFEVRARAIIAFADHSAKTDDPVRAVSLLAALYAQAPDDASRLRMERLYATDLRDLPEEPFRALLRQTGTRPQNVFPHALIQGEGARRGARASLAPSTTSHAAPGAPLLAQNATRTQGVGTDQPAALLPRRGALRVALVLPLTGRFGSTGQKVLRGANAARHALAAKGRNVELHVINTEAADWRAQLAALPQNVAVVGGPLLNTAALNDMQADGALQRHVVFSFQPDLGPIGEGRQAWRFYPSLTDQARALLTLTAGKLGIRSVAVLAPQTHYGQRMAEVFEAEAKARGLRVAATGTYPPDEHTKWLASVSRLLKVPARFHHNKNMVLPMPDFGAVFLPEDWDQAEMLTSDFYYLESEHLVFLGTDLWSVGLDNAKEIDDTYFQHAVCPGAWWPETEGARALQTVLDAQGQGPQADFWVALGYDFVRMADRLGIEPGWTPAVVNARLAGLSGMDYSMAPVSWSAKGVERQDLYVFTPRAQGKTLVDAAAMRDSVDKARALRQRKLGAHKAHRAVQSDKQ